MVSYLASTDGGASFDAYMTESRNAAAAEPLFWSAVVNDPSESVLKQGASELYANRIQLLRPHIADDGTPWAAFHCYDTELCPGERLGLAAQLRRTAANSACTRRRSVVLRLRGLRDVRVHRVVARVGRRRIGASRKRRIRINLTRVSGNPARVILRVTGTRAGRKVRVKRVRRVRTCVSRTPRL